MNLTRNLTRSALRTLRTVWGIGQLSAIGAVALVVSILGSPAQGGPVGPDLGPWHSVSWKEVPAAAANQGVATVTSNSGLSHLVTRGSGSVSPALSAAGWSHIGDPGSRRGYVLDAYQAHPGKRSKLFVLTTPTGHQSRWVHRDVRGEMINNSFAAITPSGQWFIGGEWGKVRRLLVYPMPQLNSAARTSRHNLPLSGVIALSKPVRNVQGCSFSSPTVLFCATNDPRTDLFPMPRQLLQITLAHKLDGHRTPGVARVLGSLPQHSPCPGTSEVEGIDVSGRRLTVITNQPNVCHGESVLLTYAR